MVGVGNHLIGAWGLSTLIFLQLNPRPFQAFQGAQRRGSTLLVGQTEVASFGYNQYLTSDWSTQRNFGIGVLLLKLIH